jgi:addiction module HigA family antidote
MLIWLIIIRRIKPMPMKNPPHPGEIIRDLCIEPLGLTVTQAAEGLGVTRKTLSLLLNGHAGISPEMAVRLSKAFGRSPESWLQLQIQYDLAQVREWADEIKIKPFFSSVIESVQT